MTRHVSSEALARFKEGDLSQAKAARVGAHLAGCARCAELSAELAHVTAMLASAPAPPMPGHLAARIQDTLAAEAARRVALDPGTEPGRRDLPSRSARSRLRSRSPSPSRSRSRLRLPGLSSPVALRTLAAAGVIAVIAGGGYAIIDLQGSAGPGSQSTSSRALPGSGFGPAAAPRATAGVNGLPVAGPELRYGLHGRPGSVVPVATGTNFGSARLAMQVSSTLSQVRDERARAGAGSSASLPSAASPGGDHGDAAPPSQAAARFGGLPVAVLAACVSRIAAGKRVLLVDVARYLGRRATIIVTALPGTTALRVWVVGPACSGSVSDVIAQRQIPGS